MPHNMRLARPGRSDNSGWWGLGILVVIGLVIGGFFLIRHLYRSHVLSPFEASRGELVAMKPPLEVPPTGGPCQGNVMTIDAATGQFDHTYFDFPGELQAPDPASVKTV